MSQFGAPTQCVGARLLGVLFLLLFSVCDTAHGNPPPVLLHAEKDRVELANASQKLSFVRDQAGKFRMSTFTRQGEEWAPLFDGEMPLLQGADFDLLPDSYEVIESLPDRAVVELSGKHPTHGYDWTLRCEAKAETSLIAFRLKCRLEQPLILQGLEPQVALWMRQPRVDVVVNQGPGNIYNGSADVEWGNSFPAAYLWHEGKEAAIFFNVASLNWMSHRNLFRFRDCRVQAFSETGRTGFGLRVVKRNFHELPAGKLTCEFFLHSASSADRPSELEALDRLVRIVAPLHPSTAPQPLDRLSNSPAKWATFAKGVSENLMLKEVVWDDIAVPEDKPWRDAPAFPERTLSQLRVSTDYAVDSACNPASSRKSVRSGWDFSTCNNYLAGWIGYDRLNPDPERHRFLAAKITTLPLFYDPKAQLIRHGTRNPPVIGDREMAWQNFTFAIEMDKVRRLMAPEDFDPALAGKFLQGVDGLVEFAHRVNYLFPQWFDPYKKQPMVQGDQPELGIVYEPWQAGSYAYIMCSAYELTGDKKYQDEAKAAVERLFGGMQFTVENEKYKVTYSNPNDFPITEIFGNAWGVAACAKLHRWTDDERFLKASDHFLNSLLRMTYWYESKLRDDPKDLAIGNAGLIRNHAGAYTGSPWENGEAYLALTVRLRDSSPPREPLLRMFNTYRQNSFFFFPPVFPDVAAPCDRLMKHRAAYLAIEDTYTHEHGGANGGMGRAAYMSGVAFWNYLMFEALATAGDAETLVLNLDVMEGFEESIRSARRNFLLFNPARVAKKVTISMKQLAAGNYRVLLDGRVHSERVSAEKLREGVEFTLEPEQSARLVVERESAPALIEEIKGMTVARDRLACAYRWLQDSAAAVGLTEELSQRKSVFQEGLEAFRQGKYREAEGFADGVLKR